MLNSTNWLGYISAIMLIGISFAAVFLAQSLPGARQVGPLQLPPIIHLEVDASFTGNHTFGFWTLVCENVKPHMPAGAPAVAARRICRTNAQKRVQSNDQILLAAGFNVLFVGPEKQPGVLFRLPPSASAGDHINFAVDKNAMFQAPLGRCSADECIVQGMLPPEALDQMKVGSTLTVIYTASIDDKNRAIQVEQSLHGFRESFDALTKATAGP